jgi:hypothetical protein
MAMSEPSFRTALRSELVATAIMLGAVLLGTAIAARISVFVGTWVAG